MNDSELGAEFGAMSADQMAAVGGGGDGEWARDVVYGLAVITTYAVAGWLKFVRTTPIDTAFL